MKRMNVTTLFIAAVSFVLVQTVLFAGISCAAFPDKPITLIVPFDPGSTSDLIGRTLAAGAEKALGARLVVENHGGGGGTVGMAILANAAPDGYTVAVGPSDVVAHNPIMLKVPYKPLKSFTPVIAMDAVANTALIVNKDAPWKTFQEFIDYAKKNPGKIKYSTMGVGSALHAAMEFIAKKDGIKWTHVPYKAASQARIAMMGGHVDVCSAGAEFVPFAKEGVIRVLVVHGEKRSPQFPDVPNLKELGYDFTKETLHCVFAPANLPPEILQKLEAGFTKAMETPEFKGLIEKVDCSINYLNSKDLTKYLTDLWPRTVKMLVDADIIKESATPPY
jgi:tripartite-type tricarboxylate transporter receptor subunit TctC